MKKHIEFAIKLTVMGPFLCSAKGDSRWGVDALFEKDTDEKEVIRGSHIKGKLREAWKELQPFYSGLSGTRIDQLLGKENSAGNYEPERGRLYFSDFHCTGSNGKAKKYHRVRIEKESGIADEGALLTYATPFPGGSVSEWEGNIEVIVEESEIAALEEQLKLGLRWITALGAHKGIGFGRLTEVEVTRSKETDVKAAPDGPPEETPTVIGIKIIPEEPLLLGGVKRKGIYLESETVITGAVLKGSLAACILQRVKGSSNGVLEDTSSGELSTLSKYFERIRFTHAFPAKDSNTPKRPVVIPLSTVIANRKYYDVLYKSGPGLIDDDVPRFQIDWKGDEWGPVSQHFGMASPSRVARTRTAIDAESRRAKQEQLFTYLYTVAQDDANNKLCWISNIYLPTELSEADRKHLYSELKFVIEEWWKRLGKRNSKVQIEIMGKEAEAAIKEDSLPESGAVTITLQSDALMINPDAVDENSDMKMLYKEFWDEISGQALTLKEEHLFAAQKMLGGYLAQRYKQGKYYPFYLTTAGSTFVLEVKKSEAKKMLERWKQTGLPLPGWAKLNNGKSDWQNCPFVPQNGFGEIWVNLTWHEDAKNGIEFKEDQK